MEVKNGEKSVSVPVLAVVAIGATIGVIVTDICRTIGQKRK